MPRYTKKIWGNINKIYSYKKFFYLSNSQNKEVNSSIPAILLNDNRIYIYSGKELRLFKVKNEIKGHKFGELLFSRKYRPAKYRKSKKKKINGRFT